MNRTEAIRQTEQEYRLVNLGFTFSEARQLRRISMTLHRWYELECGTEAGFIERDPETDKPCMVRDNGKTLIRWSIPDRETGAIRRLRAILADQGAREGVTPVSFYIQTDPRGHALWILRPGDVPEGKRVDSYYTNGICIH